MDDRELLRYAYAAFNARDVDAALATLHPDVDWPNNLEGGRVIGRDAVRLYWTRQWSLVDGRVEPLAFTPLDDGRVAVDARQTVLGPDGTRLADERVRHVYRVEGGRIRSMEIAPPPAE